MGIFEKLSKLFHEYEDEAEYDKEEEFIEIKEEPVKKDNAIIIRGSYFEDEEETTKKITKETKVSSYNNTNDDYEEDDFDLGEFLDKVEKETQPKDEGNLGVFLYQAIISTVIAIAYTLTATFVAPISESVLFTIKSITANDFSFSETVYQSVFQSVGTFFTYINQQHPLELNINNIIPTESEVTFQESLTLEDVVTIQDSEGVDTTNIELEEVDENDYEDIEDTQVEEFTQLELPLLDEITFEEETVNANATIKQELPVNVTLTPIIFAGDIIFPISDNYYITSNFGFRTNPITKADEFHSAYDLAANEGTNIFAVLDGTVVDSRLGEDLGNFITIDHGNGLTTLYGHCYELLVKAGDKVKQGDVIATVGSTGTSTGNHLHFGMKMNGIYFDPAYIFSQFQL